MKLGTLLYVTNDDATTDELSGLLRTLGSDLLITRKSLAAAVLFITRNVTVVLLQAPDSNLARLLKKLRPDVKIVALAPADSEPEYIDACVPASGHVEEILNAVA